MPLIYTGKLRLLAVILWASPWSLVGISFGLLGLCTGGRWQRRERVWEFHGGVLASLLRRIPIKGGAVAITLGHTILGRTPGDLDRARTHELVHVAQYERWGPVFVPAYLLSSLYLTLKGKDPYLDNPFEKEAYGVSHPSRRMPRRRGS